MAFRAAPDAGYDHRSGGPAPGAGSLRRRHELRSPLLTRLLVCQLAGDDSRRTVALWPAGFLNADIREWAETCWLRRAGGLVPDSQAVMGMRTRSEPTLSLVNRQRERAALDGLLGDLRSGRGRALVVRGEAGVGKSALLEYVTGAAAGM